PAAADAARRPRRLRLRPLAPSPDGAPGRRGGLSRAPRERVPALHRDPVGRHRGLDGRQAHDEPRARTGVLDDHAAAVLVDDRAYDREPEAERGAVVARAAHEALEDAVAEVERHAGPVVLDDELGLPVAV